jgi:hypothetical protein
MRLQILNQAFVSFVFEVCNIAAHICLVHNFSITFEHVMPLRTVPIRVSFEISSQIINTNYGFFQVDFDNSGNFCLFS